jgi:D-amino-acid dehydrogenase
VLPWPPRFLRHTRRDEVARIATALRGLLAPIFDSYAPLVERAGAQHLLRRTGCLYVYSSAQAAARWQWGMNLRRSLGVDLRDVGEEELTALEPDLKGGSASASSPRRTAPPPIRRRSCRRCMRAAWQTARASCAAASPASSGTARA